MAGDQRVVISARVIGAVHRDTPKLKMFMTSVLWSDNTEVIIYRSFQEFRKCHMQLKKRFPIMNIFKKKDRVIPKFRGQARKSSQKKGSKRSIQRMKFLESYCEKLLKCDQSVTRTPEVTQFFMPKDHDLLPDFTKNSIMILMSDGGGGEVSHQPRGSVTHPFFTQTYSCVAAYETKDTKNRPFKVAVDEKLDVLIKDPAGWWLVENDSKGLAWFPAPYLQLLDGEDEEDTVFQHAVELYCAVRSYTTKRHDEVSVPIGSVVEVLRKSDDGWWLVRFNGKAGYTPSMNLQPYSNPRAGLYSLQRKLHSSTLNLASSREAPALRRSSDITGLRSDSAAQFRGRLHKARSLDVLSETRTQMERDAEEARARSMSSTGTDTSFSDFESTSNLADNSGDLYCAVRSYTTKKHDEVSVPIGSVVEVLRKSDDGWWLVRFNGKAGYTPSMNLQPYNNPRAGLYSLQRKLHSSTLNLPSSREAPALRRSSDITGLRSDSAAQFRGRLHKARSLDVLSETRTQMERDAEEARARSMSSTSTDTSFSDFESTSNLTDIGSPLASPQQSDGNIDLSLLDRRGSDTSDERSESASSNVSRTSSVVPQVPPRPKTEEILTRCSTMTRKAALANRTRLQSLP